MKNEKTTFLTCYTLLQRVLTDAFNVATHYFTYPYDDISKIDQGIRATVWTNYNDEDTKISFSAMSADNRIIIVKSNLGFYNVIIFFNSADRPDFISVGPFRNDKLSPDYFTEILKEAHISPTTIQGIKYIYESMPFAQLDAVVNVTKHILCTYLPEYEDISPELFQYAEQKRAVEVDTGTLENTQLKASEEYAELLLNFLRCLKSGKYESTKKALYTFLQGTKLTVNKNMRDYKMLMQALNNYCHIALLETTIHPSYILKQSFSLSIKIDNTTSFSKLEQIPNELCRKYCLLVKNYALPDYSKITRDIIAYIQLHLDEDLSLSTLAAEFDKNPSVLSNTFSKETGQSLTKFIQQVRTREAIRLFNTTDLSVSEVAIAVGYQDFSYFSKIFSKIVGYSPREYKNRGVTK